MKDPIEDMFVPLSFKLYEHEKSTIDLFEVFEENPCTRDIKSAGRSTQYSDWFSNLN